MDVSRSKAEEIDKDCETHPRIDIRGRACHTSPPDAAQDDAAPRPDDRPPVPERNASPSKYRAWYHWHQAQNARLRANELEDRARPTNVSLCGGKPSVSDGSAHDKDDSPTSETATRVAIDRGSPGQYMWHEWDGTFVYRPTNPYSPYTVSALTPATRELAEMSGPLPIFNPAHPGAHVNATAAQRDAYIELYGLVHPSNDREDVALDAQAGLQMLYGSLAPRYSRVHSGLVWIAADTNQPRYVLGSQVGAAMNDVALLASMEGRVGILLLLPEQRTIRSRRVSNTAEANVGRVGVALLGLEYDRLTGRHAANLDVSTHALGVGDVPNIAFEQRNVVRTVPESPRTENLEEEQGNGQPVRLAYENSCHAPDTEPATFAQVTEPVPTHVDTADDTSATLTDGSLSPPYSPHTSDYESDVVDAFATDEPNGPAYGRDLNASVHDQAGVEARAARQREYEEFVEEFFGGSSVDDEYELGDEDELVNESRATSAALSADDVAPRNDQGAFARALARSINEAHGGGAPDDNDEYEEDGLTLGPEAPEDFVIEDVRYVDEDSVDGYATDATDATEESLGTDIVDMDELTDVQLRRFFPDHPRTLALPPLEEDDHSNTVSIDSMPSLATIDSDDEYYTPEASPSPSDSSAVTQDTAGSIPESVREVFGFKHTPTAAELVFRARTTKKPFHVFRKTSLGPDTQRAIRSCRDEVRDPDAMDVDDIEHRAVSSVPTPAYTSYFAEVAGMSSQSSTTGLSRTESADSVAPTQAHWPYTRPLTAEDIERATAEPVVHRNSGTSEDIIMEDLTYKPPTSAPQDEHRFTALLNVSENARRELYYNDWSQRMETGPGPISGSSTTVRKTCKHCVALKRKCPHTTALYRHRREQRYRQMRESFVERLLQLQDHINWRGYADYIHHAERPIPTPSIAPHFFRAQDQREAALSIAVPEADD
ncbi:hypothetical protein EIP86_004726, partial [Pleurotus ostreatoroseus]